MFDFMISGFRLLGLDNRLHVLCQRVKINVSKAFIQIRLYFASTNWKQISQSVQTDFSDKKKLITKRDNQLQGDRNSSTSMQKMPVKIRKSFHIS
jgi:hypothetical protein